MRFGIIPIVVGVIATILLFNHVTVPDLVPFRWKLGIYAFGFLMVMGALKLIFDTIAELLFWDKKKDKGE